MSYKLFLSVVGMMCIVPSLFGQQCQVSDNRVSLNYVFIRNDAVIYDLTAMFMAHDNLGNQLEFKCFWDTPGHLIMYKDDYEKLKRSSDIVLRFTTKEDRRGPTYWGTVDYDIPLGTDVFDENYVEIRVYDKKRMRVYWKERNRKVKARLMNNGKSYVSYFYASGASHLFYCNWH